MALRTLLLLLACNLIWSASPVLSKLVMRDFDTAEAAWLRYVSALLAYLLVIPLLRGPLLRGPLLRGPLLRGPLLRRHAGEIRFFAVPKRRIDWLFLPAIGVLTFCFSPVLQMAGLSASRAVDGALIIAMEPLLAILLAATFLRERLRSGQVVAFLVALLGFALLAELRPSQIVWGGRSMGNLILLLSIVGEAAYSVLGKNLTTRHSAVAVFGSALGIGVTLLMAFTWMWTGAVTPDFSKMTVSSALAVLWLGPLATMVGYLYWMSALRHAPVAGVVVTLFVQPVFGSFLGVVLLGERLTPVQTSGAALILGAVFGKPLLSLLVPRLRPRLEEEAQKSTAPNVILQ